MEELPIPIPSEEVEKFYCDLYSISARLTDAKNRYRELCNSIQRGGILSQRESLFQAGSIKSDLIKIETEIVQLMEMLKPRPPKCNIFTGEPEQETASENDSNPATTYTITRNDLLDETRYYIRLIDGMLDPDSLCPLVFSMADNLFPAQGENEHTKSQRNIFDEKDTSDVSEKDVFEKIINFYIHQGRLEDNGKKFSVLGNGTGVWILSLYEVLRKKEIVKNIIGNTGSIENHCVKIKKLFDGLPVNLNKSYGNNKKHGNTFTHKFVSIIISELQKENILPL